MRDFATLGPRCARRVVWPLSQNRDGDDEVMLLISMKHIAAIFGLLLTCAPALRAELALPAIISDHMVLQQKHANPIWGWDTPGTKVRVTFAGQTKTATAGSDGRWTVILAPVPANATPQTLTVAGTTRREIRDVLIGEVWMCSGQSNMQWTVSQTYDGDIEAAASYPRIRLIRVPRVGSQDLRKDFEGSWQPSTPGVAREFSGVGFRFGRTLHQIIGVPIGLIDNSCGGSAAEAWVRRESLERDARFKPLMDATVKREAEFKSPNAATEHAAAMEKWKLASEQAKAEKKTPPIQPPAPAAWLTGNRRPGNMFGAMLHPTLGYGLKGVIWYQGETNAPRAHEYADLFPFLIEEWRREWGQGDFPFYWVQLADFHAENVDPGDSDWAELREAQTKALRLPNTGQAVIIDVGEGNNVHPGNKYSVAMRLVRWALAKEYGVNIRHRSPQFKSMATAGKKVTITFDCFGSTLRPFDVAEPRGFAVCDEDKVWHWASGQVTATDKIEIWSERVSTPIAVRYAWADNPVCNLFTNEGLPVTPFRTDNFEMITKPKPAAVEGTR